MLGLKSISKTEHLLQSLLGKGGQDEAGLVDLSIVVAALGLLLLRSPLAERNADIAVGIFAADHEANLSRGVGRDGGVSVFGNGEYLLAVLFELRDEGQVKPLVLGCATKRYKSAKYKSFHSIWAGILGVLRRQPTKCRLSVTAGA